MATTIQPISEQWREDLPSQQSSVLFRVSADHAAGNIIYTGRALVDAHTGKARVVFNDIVAPYMRVPFPDLVSDEYVFSERIPWFFLVEYQGDNGQWQALPPTYLWPDWSYRGVTLSGFRLLTQQIGRHVTVHTPIFVTVLNAVGVRLDVYAPDGTFRASATSSSGTAETCGTAAFDLRELVFEGDGYITATALLAGGAEQALGLRWDISPCEHPAIYWLNDLGGWDFLLLPADPRYTDTVSRHSAAYSNGIDNDNTPPTFANEVKRSISFGTGWLSDEESQKMRGLFRSVDVRYCNYAEDWDFVPLAITDESVEYKTYKSNGGRLVRYSWNADIAKTYEVR